MLFVYLDQRLGFCLCLWDQKPTHLPYRAEGACLQTRAVENSCSSAPLPEFLPPLNDRLHLFPMNVISAFPGNSALFVMIKKIRMFLPCWRILPWYDYTCCWCLPICDIPGYLANRLPLTVENNNWSRSCVLLCLSGDFTTSRALKELLYHSS